MSDPDIEVIENIRVLPHFNPFPGRSMGDGFFYCNYKKNFNK